MKHNQPITKLMTTGLITVHTGDPISKVRKLLREHHIHHVPVVSGHDLLGIISASDILRVSFGDTFDTDERTVDATLDHTMTLEDVMQKNVRTLRKSATVRDAAEVLVKGDFHAVPIVEADDKTLVGMVTSTDLIRHLLEA